MFSNNNNISSVAQWHPTSNITWQCASKQKCVAQKERRVHFIYSLAVISRRLLLLKLDDQRWRIPSLPTRNRQDWWSFLWRKILTNYFKRWANYFSGEPAPTLSFSFLCSVTARHFSHFTLFYNTENRLNIIFIL